MSDGGVSSQSVRVPGVLVEEVPHPGGAVATADPFTDPATGDVAGAGEVSAGAASEAGAVPDAPAEKKKPAARGAAMAAGGRPVEAPGPAPAPPAWPQRPMGPDEVYVPEEFDFSDLTEVNRQLNHARARIFRVSQALKLAQRTLAEAQIEYDREMRRQLVSISGGTEASRRALAEINCEHLENRIVVGRQVVEEWRKRSLDARDDLKAIENIAHNVRAQMDIR